MDFVATNNVGIMVEPWVSTIDGQTHPKELMALHSQKCTSYNEIGLPLGWDISTYAKDMRNIAGPWANPSSCISDVPICDPWFAGENPEFWAT